MRCAKCGEVKRLVLDKGLCETCYGESLKIKKYKIQNCAFCGKEKIIAAEGLCRTCYSRKQRSGSPEYIKVRKTCTVDGCNNFLVAKGLCGMHSRRWERHKHLGQTRPKGWGATEKHPLHGIWIWRKRTNQLCDEWLDFWKFVKEIEDRPSSEYNLVAINPNEKISKENYEWKLPILKRKTSESFKEYARNYQKQYRKTNANKIKNTSLKKHFGITLDEYDALLGKQNGVCAICGQRETHKQKGEDIPQDLAVDHCHKTNKVRGLLCVKCNTGIGSFKDSIELLTKAVKYLEAHEN